jgi:hypothetical protein
MVLAMAVAAHVFVEDEVSVLDARNLHQVPFSGPGRGLQAKEKEKVAGKAKVLAEKEKVLTEKARVVVNPRIDGSARRSRSVPVTPPMPDPLMVPVVSTPLPAISVCPADTFVPRVPYLFVREHLSEWLQFRDPMVISLIQHGVNVRMNANPMSLQNLFRVSQPSRSDPDVVLELQRLVASGACRMLSSAERERTKFWLPVWCVKKKNGAARLITDARAINSITVSPKFKQDTVQTLLTMLEQQPSLKFGTSLDLREFFFHLPLHPNTSRWFRCAAGNLAVEWQTLPFGWKASPFFSQRLILPILRLLRAEGLALIWYVDDLLILAESPEQCRRHSERVLSLLGSLGMQLNLGKSNLVPASIVSYLGFSIDLDQRSLALDPGRLSVLTGSLKSVRRSHRVTPLRLSQLAGSLLWAEKAYPALRSLARSLAAEAGRRARNGWSQFIPVTQVIKDLLKEAHVALWRAQPRRILSPNQLWRLETDACNTGWGAVLYPPVTSPLPVQKFYGRFRYQAHITFLESEAVRLALQLCLHRFPPGSHVQVITDASATAALWSKGSSKPHLAAVARPLMSVLNQKGISLSCRWRAGVENSEPDRLSRLSSPPYRSCNDENDYMLRRSLFRFLQTHFRYKVVLDMFASGLNSQVPLFWSRYPEPGSAGVDAFAFRWSGLNGLYANPPWPLIPQILQRLLLEKAIILLVFPRWHGAPWWPLLMSMVTKLVDLPRGPLYVNERCELLPPPRWGSCAALLVSPLCHRLPY